MVDNPSSPTLKGPGGVELINVTLKNLMEEPEEGSDNTLKVKLKKSADMTSIKDRVEMEFGIPQPEQIILFRGVHIAKREMTKKENAFQPLNTPDLADIVAEAGEAGLSMSIIHKPYQLPAFMRKEKFGAEEYNRRFKPSGATLLHRAVRRLKIYVVEELLIKEEFEECNGRDKYGQTALHTACTCWQRELVKVLVASERFTAINARDVEGRHVLHYIACWGDAEAGKAVLAHEKVRTKDILLQDKRGFTPLQLATECGHTQIVEAMKEVLAAREGVTEEEDDGDEDFNEEHRRRASGRIDVDPSLLKKEEVEFKFEGVEEGEDEEEEEEEGEDDL